MQIGIQRDFESAVENENAQTTGFKMHLEAIKSKSVFYQNLFKSRGIDSDELNTIDDLKKLPFTTKSDLEKYNQDFLCVTGREVVEFVTTSGTLGNPITMALTKKDLNRLAYNEARSLSICGVTDQDIVQITTTLDKRFMAGMAYYLGATNLGAAVIRAGIGDLSFQLDNILRYKPTVLIAVPSFAYKLGKFLEEQGADLSKFSIKKIICIGEPIRNAQFEPNRLLEKTQQVWGKTMFSTYASTEMATAFTECEHGLGGHVIPELMIVELIDEHGKKVKDGEPGEVVATPLGVEGMPLLRYKTGDLARLHTGVCACGRSTPRLGPIEGRKEQMIKFKGTSLYPEQIENVLHGIEEVDQFLIELGNSPLGMDHLQVHLSDELSIEAIKKIEDQLAEKLRVRPEVLPIPLEKMFRKSMVQKNRKPRRFIDTRKKN